MTTKTITQVVATNRLNVTLKTPFLRVKDFKPFIVPKDKLKFCQNILIKTVSIREYENDGVDSFVWFYDPRGAYIGHGQFPKHSAVVLEQLL